MVNIYNRIPDLCLENIQIFNNSITTLIFHDFPLRDVVVSVLCFIMLKKLILEKYKQVKTKGK